MLTESTLTALPSLQASGLVDFDATVFVSAAFFLAFYFAMKALLFDPYLKIVQEREALTGGASDEAASFRERAATVLSDYQAQLTAARDEAARVRAELRAQGEADEARIVAAAREQAQSQLAQRRQTLAQEVEAAEREISSRAQALSSAIVARVM